MLLWGSREPPSPPITSLPPCSGVLEVAGDNCTQLLTTHHLLLLLQLLLSGGEYHIASAFAAVEPRQPVPSAAFEGS